LGVSAPLKSRYRSEIAKLASLNDALPVKKQRFATCYNLARKETFTPRLLRVGWKAAGIYPYNPQKALNSSQVKAPIQQSSTPPLPSQNNLFTTPKGSQHIHQQATSVRESSSQNQALFHV
jgi:hypothetical protein